MSWVYFIKPIDMPGPVKIGCSYSPTARRDTLRYWSPFPLEIVAEIEGSQRLERQFHAMFAHTYMSHEWFKWSPELQAVIDAIAGGSFDLATLPDPESLPRKAKDTSYITPGWKYERSVISRLRHLERRGADRDDISPIYMRACRADSYAAHELASLRAELEPLLEAITASLPTLPSTGTGVGV